MTAPALASIEFYLPGRLIPYPRPRPRAGGGFYQPPEYVSWHNDAYYDILAALGRRRRLFGKSAVTVEIEVVNPNPLADVDNLAKSVLDVLQLQGVVIDNDRQVKRLVVERHRRPREGAHTRVKVARYG